MPGPLFILLVSLAGVLEYSLISSFYSVDIFMLACCYISLYGSYRSGIYIAWVLGIIRAAFAAPLLPAADSFGQVAAGLSAEAGFRLAVYPLMFLGICAAVHSFRYRLKAEHPATQVLLVGILAVGYHFISTLVAGNGPLIARFFLCWDTILVLALFEAFAALVCFRIMYLIYPPVPQDREY